MVPVLSSTTVSMSWSRSRASADLMRMPLAAPRPVPTMTAVGVASPSAQGQEITNTEMAMERANSTPRPARSHIAPVARAMAITMGTKTPLTRSAILAMGALELVASSTRRTICARVVSSPTPVTRIFSQPPRTVVAPTRRSPGTLSTGMLSPVIADSSTAAAPSVSTPSAGMACPDLTTAISPLSSSSIGIATSAPSRSTTAVRGARSIRRVMASDVRRLARASKNLPSVMRVRIIPADSM